MLRYVAPLLVLLAVAAAVPSLGRRAAQEDPRAEAARIEQRLQRIEARVMEGDAELRRMNQALGQELLAAMEAARPGVADDARRLAALRSADGAAEGTAAEARRLEARVDSARRAALGEPRLASMVQAFQHLLRERMIRSDPRARRLLARYEQLHGGSGEAGP